MTKEEAEKAQREGTWLVCRFTDDELVKIRSYLASYMLYKTVRSLSGTPAYVGRHRLRPATPKELLELSRLEHR
jgi:hypothetical protein